MWWSRRKVTTAQSIQIALPTRAAHRQRLLARERLDIDTVQGEVDRRSLAGQPVAAHNAPDQAIVDLNVGASHV